MYQYSVVDVKYPFACLRLNVKDVEGLYVIDIIYFNTGFVTHGRGESCNSKQVRSAPALADANPHDNLGCGPEAFC
jgi:hypothetical protein